MEHGSWAFTAVALNLAVMRPYPAIGLRAARSSDLDSVAQIWHDSAGLPGVGPPVMPTVQQLRQRVDAELATGWKLAVAVNDGEVVGMLAVRLATSVLEQLFVRPSHIGQQVGKVLLQEAMNSMPDGFKLFTATANRRAQAFYERQGLVFLREGPDPRTGRPVLFYGWKVC